MAKAASTTVSGALRAAAEHHAAGRLDAAERLCDEVLATLPEHAEALHRQGVVAFQRGALLHAAGLVRRAIAADPTQPDYHASLGDIELEREDYAPAVQCFQQSLALGADDPGVRIGLGIALYGAGQRGAARAALEDGVRRAPAHARAHAALGQIALDDGNDADAAAQLRAAALFDDRYGYGASCVFGDDLAAYADAGGIDEMLEAAPALTGEMPVRDRPGPVVVTACDHRGFRRFARPLAASLDANAPGHDLHIHVVNPEPGLDDELDALRSSLGATVLTASREAAPGADAVYRSNMRLVRLHQIMAACGRALIGLDVDSLVRGALDGLDDLIAAGELAVTLCPDKAEIGRKMPATTVVLRPTAAVREYLLRVASYILNCYHEERLATDLDRSVLYLVHRMMESAREAPVLAPLPKAYADNTFAAASPIWTARGDRNPAPAFIAEAAGYAIPLGRRGPALRTG